VCIFCTLKNPEPSTISIESNGHLTNYITRFFLNHISSLSLKARELKFSIKTPHINAKKVTQGIFEILSEGLRNGLFLAQSKYEKSICKISALYHLNWGTSLRWHTDGWHFAASLKCVCVAKKSTLVKFLHFSTCFACGG